MAASRRDLMVSAAALAGLAGLGACARVRAALPSLPAPAPASPSGARDDATALAGRVRAGQISAAEALEEAITRVEAVNPELNFMAERLYDYARARAGGAVSGPLAGVPTLIKDLTALAGAPLRFGSRAYAGNVATEHTPLVETLLNSGLIPFGKSTTPEFGLTPTTEPLLTGATRNPWDPTRSSGGSSGGAASAVASGAVAIAHATDGGGSIRIPASCCGLVGLKVSRDRHGVAGAPQRALSISVAGCLSRSVRDTALWLAVTERMDEGAPYPPVRLVSGPGSRRLRIGLRVESLLGPAPDADVARATGSVAALCGELGHEVVQAPMPIDGEAFAEAFSLLWAAGAAEIVDEVSAAQPGVPLERLLEPLTLALAEHYRTAPEGALQAAVNALQVFELQYAAMFENFDVLLTPVLTRPAPPIGELAPTLPFDTLMARMRDYVGYTPLQNAAGAPAISLPLSASPDGLPIGAHFSAPKGEERRLLELAYELEAARPWAARRPPVWAP